MSDPLGAIRARVRGPADAVRWACVLEATAPKAGNVFPGMAFGDLCYRDFVLAADIASDAMADDDSPISSRVLNAVRRSVAETGTNVNLGILLLLGPLVGADEALGRPAAGVDRLECWYPAVADFLVGIDGEDGKRIFQAIAGSLAGGLGVAAEQDVHAASPDEINLIEAMRLAAHHDRIARQYSCGFRDLLDNVLPVVAAEISSVGDVLSGIASAHLRLLSTEPDSLIARKRGREVATAVQKRAAKLCPHDASDLAEFDGYLRDHEHSLNPGTTADLIAASLYLLLRTRPTACRES